jgi:hypothetical protein
MAENIQMVVTEVTMYGRLRCVAGWDFTNKRMVRPEPAPEQFWEAIYCGERSTFHPGHVVTFEANKPETALPHQTEDWVVAGGVTNHGPLPIETFQKVCKKSIVDGPGPDQAYGPHLRFSGFTPYVLEGTECSSLCGLELPASELTFLEKMKNTGDVRLRAGFSLSGQRLDLSIAAKDFRQTYRAGGLQAAKDLVAGAESLHIRLGLARAMDDGSGRCYLQINGIYPI